MHERRGHAHKAERACAYATFNNQSKCFSQGRPENEKYFCVWPITEVARRLENVGFIKVHRSYIVNPVKVDRFERLKDKGYCVFGTPTAPKIPVSRSQLKAAQAAIITTPGAIGAK